MKKRGITIISTIVILGVIISMGIYSKKKSEIKSVKIGVTKKGDINSYLSTTAIIKSKNAKDYYGSQLRINKVNVAVGDRVKKGQGLIGYDLTDLNTGVKQAQIQYNNALLQKQDLINQRDSINSKISDLDTRIEESKNSKDPNVKAGLTALEQQRNALQPISDVKVQEADNAVALAKASLDSANSKLSSVQSGVVSGIDGVVTALNAVEGAVANPAQTLVTVQDLDNLRAVVSLGKYDAEKVKVGQEAVIKSAGKSYNGRVAFMNPAPTKTASPTGGETTLEADIDILSKPENLKVDFDADVDILLASKSNVIKIPVEAIRNDKYGNSYVFISSNGAATQKNVNTGIKSDIEAEITQGLTEGDRVILNPSSSIINGTKVKESA